MKKFNLLLLLAVLCTSATLNAQSVLLAGWDFQTTTNGGTALAAAPSTPKVINANFGTGTIYLDGTNGSSNWASTASNPQLTAFGGTAVNAATGFSTNTSGASSLALANQTANGFNVVFLVNMSAHTDLVISYATQRTSTGFNTQQWDISSDGTNWTALSTQNLLPTAFATRTLPTITALNGVSTAYIRLSVTGASTASGNNRLDNIQFNATAGAVCTPDHLDYASVPTSNINQDASFNISVNVLNSANVLQSCCTSGTVTLTANNACGLYEGSTLATNGNTVTASVINGVATFNNLNFKRSTQNGISFTASYSGSCGTLTAVTSSTINIVAPAGTFSNTTLRNENFDGSSPSWNYSVGTPVYSGTTGGGVDVTGLKNYSGNNVLAKSYSTNNLSNGKKSTTEVTFDNVTGLGSYTTLHFSFKVASLDQPGGTGGVGSGVDNGDDMIMEVSTDGGSIWLPLLTQKGSNDRVFPLSSSVNNLTWGANTIYTSPDNKSAFSTTLPAGTSQFRFRFRATNNRIQENWVIDDVQLIGQTFIGATSPSVLPVVSVTPATACPGQNTTLQSIVNNAVTPISYAWTGTGTISGSTINSSIIADAGTYTVSVTDAEGCTSSASEVISNSVPTNPSVTDGSKCSGASNGTMIAGGASSGQVYKWYDAATGGTLLYTSSNNNDNTYSASPLTTTSYWVSILDAAGCEGSREEVKIFVSTPPSPPTTTGNTVCGVQSVLLGANGAASGTQDYLWYADNVTPTATGSGSSFNTPILASPSSTDFYASIIDITTGCESSRTNATALVLYPTLPTTIGTYTQTIAHADGATHSYVTSGCDLIATIQDAAGGNTLGSTLAEVNVNNTVDLTTTAGRMYVRRDYEITANSNGPSTITLYFTQADFDDFNNYNASNMSNYYLPLPTSGSNSDPNIPYFRIMQVIGSTISGTLQPLTWNSTENRWETTFPMTNTNARYFVYTMPSCIGVVVNNFAVAAVNGTSANATWNAVTAPASGWYSIQMENVSDNPGVWVNLGTSSNATTSRTITGLIPCKTYNFQIRRHCSSQSEGPWSSSVTITTPCNCGTPTGLAASNISNGGATVSWTSVSGAASYTIQYKPTSSSSWSAVTAPGTSTSTNLVGLASSATYDVQIRTICTGNGSQSPWSSTVNFTTTNVCMPPAPTVSFVNYDNVGVSWPVVSGCTWYRVRYREAGTTTWSPISTVSNVASPLFIFKNLTTGVTYETQYATVCGLPNVSAWSATLNITPQIQCPTPTNLTDSAISSTKVKLKWDAGTPTPSWYNIRYRVLGSTAWIIVTSTPNSTILNNLTAGTTYEYQVLSKCASQTTSNAINTSPWSSMATFSTGTSLKPSELDEENSDYIKVFPNPFVQNIQVEISSTETKELELKLADVSGRIIVSKIVNSTEGLTHLNMEVPVLSQGIYYLQIWEGHQMKQILKLAH